MTKKLTSRDMLFIGMMLFGMFFGAGNLIFPVFVGQQAGTSYWPALIGFLISGVGLPLLGVAAIGITKTDGVFTLAQKVNRCTPMCLRFCCTCVLDPYSRCRGWHPFRFPLG